ncbi:hypothetical protein [Metabacillus arenae]|uniref:Membrane protein NfeD2 N-terminal transmembrane domain-containing protein n=1 Tax=Metabacillus arenae TaxID=2771434 RepID=A0A926NKD9_9BACI|nr:hypothetical protein [Metabacillus arenae]MBD1381578.1 hypothetical protein [Metabacillus arenae]
MELFGTSLETIYFYGLIIAGSLTFLYILFGDVLEGVFEGITGSLLNPTLLFSFLTIFTANGYLFELITSLHSGLIFLISLGISSILVTLLNVFVLIPLSSAEESLSYSESDLKGRMGVVITSIPVDGYGEVILKSNSGSIAKPAISFDSLPIPSGSNVLVIDVQSGVLSVVEQKGLDEI